jgi:hypothetical protein
MSLLTRAIPTLLQIDDDAEGGSPTEGATGGENDFAGLPSPAVYDPTLLGFDEALFEDMLPLHPGLVPHIPAAVAAAAVNNNAAAVAAVANAVGVENPADGVIVVNQWENHPVPNHGAMIVLGQDGQPGMMYEALGDPELGDEGEGVGGGVGGDPVMPQGEESDEEERGSVYFEDISSPLPDQQQQQQQQQQQPACQARRALIFHTPPPPSSPQLSRNTPPLQALIFDSPPPLPAIPSPPPPPPSPRTPPPHVELLPPAFFQLIPQQEQDLGYVSGGEQQQPQQQHPQQHEREQQQHYQQLHQQLQELQQAQEQQQQQQQRQEEQQQQQQQQPPIEAQLEEFAAVQRGENILMFLSHKLSLQYLLVTENFICLLFLCVKYLHNTLRNIYIIRYAIFT